MDPGQTVEITVTAHTGGLAPSGVFHSRVYLHYNAVGGNGSDGRIIPVDLTVPASEQVEGLPTEFALKQNFPNPFNATTLLRFEVPRESRVELEIFNLAGQEVAHPVGGVYQAGRYCVSFDASKLSSGMYLVRMKAMTFTSVEKMMLLK